MTHKRIYVTYTLLGGADTVFFPLQRDDAPGLPLKKIVVVFMTIISMPYLCRVRMVSLP